METETQHYSDLAIPPGEYLLEATTELGLNQADLARRMGRPVQVISEIVKGIKAITPDTALQLEEVLGVPAHIWTGLESDYQLIRARQQAEQQIESEAANVGCFPYAEMAKLGWVRKTRKAVEKVRELRRFFGVASLTNLPDVRSYAPAFRKSRHKNLSHEGETQPPSGVSCQYINPFLNFLIVAGKFLSTCSLASGVCATACFPK